MDKDLIEDKLYQIDKFSEKHFPSKVLFNTSKQNKTIL